MNKSVFKHTSDHSGTHSIGAAIAGDPRYLIQYPDTEKGVSYQGQPYLRILTRFLKEMGLIAPSPGDVLNTRGRRLKKALRDTDPSYFRYILDRTVIWSKTPFGSKYMKAHDIFKSLLFVADVLKIDNKDKWAIAKLKSLVEGL